MTAMLIILASVGGSDEAEFNLWYDREHLEDRLTVPGFVAARRYHAPAAPRWPWLALYETSGLDVFTSPDYLARLANQSDWSRRILPRFVDPQRNVTRLVASVGHGFGSLVEVVAVSPGGRSAVAAASGFAEAAGAAREACPDLVSVSLYESDPDLSRPVAEYPPSSPSPVLPGDWFVLADATAPLPGEVLDAVLAGLPAECRTTRLGTYRFRTAMSATAFGSGGPGVT